MNFAQMLSMTVSVDDRSRAGEIKSTGRTREEAHALSRKTMRVNRNKRWKDAFDQCGGRATANSLARVLGRTPASVNHSLWKFLHETPPVVALDGKRPNGRSNDEHIYRWIGG